MLPKTKIVCTIGPSSWVPEILAQMIQNGMTVARVNGAFATVEEMKKVSGIVRSISNEVALMIDIKGHEVRLNKFETDVDVKPGDQVVIGSDNSEYIFTETYPDLYKNVKIGTSILIDDGNTLLIVEKIEDKKIYAKVIQGTKIPKGKSLNVPGIYLDNPPITQRDIEQIQFAVEDKWDFVAASFVRSKEDVNSVRALLSGSHVKVISKIEDSFGIKNIDEIIDASEGIMVARGDLAVEIPYFKVPHLQKEIIKKCNQAVKPVIVATQMLETMISRPRPTRAEISDVANAIYDGADAVMLSAESTTGQYPLECVKVMRDIALETEKYIYESEKNILETAKLEFKCSVIDDETEISLAIARAVSDLSKEIHDSKVLVFTRTGFGAKVVSYYGLQNNIIAFTPFDYYARRLSLVKGIKAITLSPEIMSNALQDLENEMLKIATEKQIIKKDDKVILVISSFYTYSDQNTLNEKASLKIIKI